MNPPDQTVQVTATFYLVNEVPRMGLTTDPAFIKIINDNPALFVGWRETDPDSHMDGHYLHFTTERFRQAKEAVMEASEAEVDACAKVHAAEKIQEQVGQILDIAEKWKESCSQGVEGATNKEALVASLLSMARGVEELARKEVDLARVASAAARDKTAEVFGKYISEW